jgi:hypothetical protein
MLLLLGGLILVGLFGGCSLCDQYCDGNLSDIQAPEIDYKLVGGQQNFACEPPTDPTEPSQGEPPGTECLGYDLPVPPFAPNGPRGYWHLPGCDGNGDRWCTNFVQSGQQSCACKPIGTP